MTYTADDFRNARFATHPDGRIAARVAPLDFQQWATQSARVGYRWIADEDMDSGGWSPLDETRLPRVVTDEMKDAARDAVLAVLAKQKPRPLFATVKAGKIARAALDAALSAAPTTDEDEAPSFASILGDLSIATHAAKVAQEDAEDYREDAKNAREFAALWKETARHHIKHGRMFRASFNEAIKQRDHANARADLNAQSVATIEKQARTYALEQIEVAQAETTEAVTRAEKAERERDEARAFAARWKETARENIRRARAAMIYADTVREARGQSLTAREHRDAMWARGHRPVNGVIPAGTPYMFRDPDGFIGVDLADHDVPALDGPGFVERRLIDPPTPTRPDGAETLGELVGEWTATERAVHEVPTGAFASLADYLAERGVRAPEGRAS